MLLPSPCACFNVIYRRDVGSPSCLSSHFIELAVLNHHRVNNTQEAFITGKNSRTACQGVALQETLTCMFAKNFNNSASFSVGELVPLKVASSVIENSVQFVADKLIRRENTEGLWIILKRLVDEFSNSFHAGFLRSFLNPKRLPIRNV
jgi:hypothetical protein